MAKVYRFSVRGASNYQEILVLRSPYGRPSLTGISIINIYAMAAGVCIIGPPMLLHRRPFPIALSVCRVVYCGQTVQDRPIVCIKVE